MKINPKLRKFFEERKMPVEGSLAFMLSKFFELDVDRIFSAGFVKSMGKLNIKEPLFEGVDEEHDQINKFLKLFEDAAGKSSNYKECHKRFTQFFKDNMGVSWDDILIATTGYLNEHPDPKYVRLPHYFIYKGRGKDRISDLEIYLQKLKDYREKESMEQKIGFNNVE